MEQDNGEEEADVGTRRQEAEGVAHEERQCARGSGQWHEGGAEVVEARSRVGEGDTEGRETGGRTEGIGTDLPGYRPREDI